MRLYRTLILEMIGRQQGNQHALLVEHQRTVTESVRMVIHIIPVKQESTVLGTLHETVPDLTVRWLIPDCRDAVVTVFGMVDNVILGPERM